MKNLTWCALAALVAMLAAAPVATAEEKTPAAQEKPAAVDKGDKLRGEYSIMAAECKLTEEQQNTLKAKLAVRFEAQEAWMKANGSKLETLQEAVKRPKDPNDKEAIKLAAVELRALEADRLKILTTFETDIKVMMTPEQREEWAAFRLYRPMMGRYKRLALTEEQTKKVKEVAAATAKELAAVEGDDKAAQGARMDIEAKLRKNIEETILTTDQREILNKPGPPKPGTEKKPDANKPAEEKK